MRCAPIMEGYSQCHPVELKGDDRGDGLSECLQGSAVVGVENPPGLEIGDAAFDLVANRVDLGVEGLLGFVKFPTGWFAGGCDHSQADVPFVAQMGWGGFSFEAVSYTHLTLPT